MQLMEIADILNEKDNFLILTHKSPDGDTLGTGFALCYFLRDMGKKANVVNSDSFPPRYDFMYENYQPQEFEVKYVIAVDVADPQLLGSGLERYKAQGAVDLCIDHHILNKKFAKKTYVDPNASAAALIMYKIFKLSKRRISDLIAKCIYTGIATDTGCFKYENTTPQAHIVCAELMEKYNIDFVDVNRKMFDVKSRQRLEIEQSIISKIEYFYGGKCSMILLTADIIEKSGIDPAEFDGLASIPLTVEGVKIGITVKQRHENVYKVSVRTTEEIDASKFCQQFGGGGHIRAAGCEIQGTLEQVKSKLLEGVEQLYEL